MVLFSALRISGKAADAAEALAEALKERSSGSYPPRENYHVTIHYFGEQNFRTLQRIQAVLTDHPLPELTLCFDHLVRFPGSRGDQVVYAAKDCPALQEWRTSLSDALRSEHIPFDEKEFRPHITLVRGKQGHIAFEDMDVPAVAFTPAQPVLLESIQRNGRRIYRPVNPEEEE